MGPKSTEAIAYRDWKINFFPSREAIGGRCHADGITVETASGAVLTVPVNYALDRNLDTDALRAGIDVRLDGEVIGHLTQDEHGLRRANRTMLFTAAESAGHRLPSEVLFRERGLEGLSMESIGGGRLMTSLPLVMLAGLPQLWLKTPVVWVRSSDVSDELAALYVAVQIGLTAVVE